MAGPTLKSVANNACKVLWEEHPGKSDQNL
ncbi:hypothetical protein SAMN06265222_11336 [Neorhodopirellula lusitana]|uniref:Uncharacterized protein n=1 Tax=Neorhodopirellula lusitana TaxID=445327 RepID=A0ABY1QJS6_9BACT|nr:hypothetical protein SAMN06265222_11336 [Neorhodopirellula lusitana]